MSYVLWWEAGERLFEKGDYFKHFRQGGGGGGGVFGGGGGGGMVLKTRAGDASLLGREFWGHPSQENFEI